MNTLSNLSAVPLSEFKSTYINGRNTSYEMMADRIRATLGAPLINVEIHNNQLFDNIAIASEMFTKFAGYTTEYLVFDASLYETGRGVRLDKLMSITPYLTARYDNPSYRLDRKESSQTTFTTITGSSGLSATLDNFIINDEITDPLEYSIKYSMGAGIWRSTSRGSGSCGRSRAGRSC